MSNLDVFVNERTDDKIAEAIIKIYTDFINSIEKDLIPLSIYPDGLPDTVKRKLQADALSKIPWKISISTSQRGKVVIALSGGEHVSLRRAINPNAGFIDHNHFELSGKIQGSGIANKSAKASLKIADLFNIDRINVHANLDVGGYAWLRKGAYPDDGAEELLYLASRSNDKALKESFSKLFRSMTAAEQRAFILSDKFREYKKLFLGSSWFGTFDLTDEKVRLAMVGQAPKIEAVGKTLTSNQKILDAYIRRQTYILRYAKTLSNKQAMTLISTEKKLYNVVERWVKRLEGRRTLYGADGRKWQTDFQKALLGVREDAWKNVNTEVIDELKNFAVTESAGAATIIDSAVPVILNLNLPPEAQLHSIVNSQPFEGRVLKEWLEGSEFADVERIVRATKNGIVQGLTPTEVARSIIGSQEFNYQDGVARSPFKDLESIILTATNGIQNEAKQALYQANSDIIKTERFLNTLDARTTIECIAAGDSNEFRLGPGLYPLGKGPMPPLHFRCRSLRVPYIDADTLGNRGFDSSTERQLLREYSESAKIGIPDKRGNLPRGHKTKYDEFARARRRELVGQVPGQTNYSDWLKTQSSEFQNEVLGTVRAEMFRKGSITLDKFVARDGELLTLDQLRKKGFEVPLG